MNINDWESYLEDLCSYHPQLLHLSGGRRAWVPYESAETSLIHSDISSPYVRHVGFMFNGRTESQWYYTSILLFLVNVQTIDGNQQAAIAAARATAQQILEAFESRIWYDHNEGNTCSLFEEISDVQIEAAEMTDQQAYGWEMMITVGAPKTIHDTELWLDTKTPE